MAKSKRELATQGERCVRQTDRDERARDTKWRKGTSAPGQSAPVRYWEQSAFWVSVVMGVLLLTFVVVGIVGFCRYVRGKQGDERMGFFAAVSSRLCMTVGFPDWNQPLFDGWWGTPDVTDVPSETTEVLQETESESSTELDTESDTESTEPESSETDETDETDETASETESVTETESTEETTTESDSQPPVMMGDRPVVLRDMSYGARGWAYIENLTRWTPSAEGAPEALQGKTVLLLSSHPHDAYRDGGSMEELAQSLETLMKAAGMTVVRVSVPGDSYADTFAAAEEAIRYHMAVVPDVGLILDLRRSGESTEDGGVLQTDGVWAEGRCAQIRLIVDGDGTRRDLCFGTAMSLRQALWNMETSVSRPVLVRQGAGLSAAVDRQAAFLTVELGSLGNRFAEAERALPLLANAVCSILK